MKYRNEDELIICLILSHNQLRVVHYSLFTWNRFPFGDDFPLRKILIIKYSKLWWIMTGWTMNTTEELTGWVNEWLDEWWVEWKVTAFTGQGALIFLPTSRNRVEN